MTRKESGWVSRGIELAEEMCCQSADFFSEETPTPKMERAYEVAKQAVADHLTSLQSAAEGLEEALKLIRNHSSVSVHQIEIIDAALAAFQAIKEKQT